MYVEQNHCLSSAFKRSVWLFNSLWIAEKVSAFTYERIVRSIEAPATGGLTVEQLGDVNHVRNVINVAFDLNGDRLLPFLWDILL